MNRSKQNGELPQFQLKFFLRQLASTAKVFDILVRISLFLDSLLHMRLTRRFISKIMNRSILAAIIRCFTWPAECLLFSKFLSFVFEFFPHKTSTFPTVFPYFCLIFRERIDCVTNEGLIGLTRGQNRKENIL